MRAELFGQAIVESSRLSYVQQVYDILCREIHQMHWQVGERLPGVIDLANQTGLGVKTIQAAYGMLKEDGYVRTKSRKGSYLHSLFPQQENPDGVVGVLLAEGQDESPIFAYYLHALQRVSLQYQCMTEIRQTSAEAKFESLAEIISLFNGDIKGVVMLHPFPIRDCLDDQPIPWVYFGFQSYEVSPLVAVDVRMAFYELTKRAIAEGHRRIIFCEVARPELGMRALHLQGFERAMVEEGLSIDSRDLEISPSDLNFCEEKQENSATQCRSPNIACAERTPTHRGPQSGISEEKTAATALLKDHGIASGRTDAPTAIVCGSLHVLSRIAKAADVLGLSIPADLSLLTIGSRSLGQDEGGLQSTGVVMDDLGMAKRCFDLLFKDGVPRTSQLLLRTEFLFGDTLAPPRDLA